MRQLPLPQQLQRKVPIRDVDREDRRYGCMGGRMHAVQGCRVVGFVEIFAAIFAAILLFIFFFSFYSDTYAYQLVVGTGALAIGLVCCLCALAAVAIMFLGLRQENPVYMMVHVVAQIIALVGMGFAVIVAVVLLVGWSRTIWGPDVVLRPSNEGRIQDQYAAQKTGVAVGVVILILSIIGFLLESWFLTVVIGAMRYFHDKASAEVIY